MEPNYTNEPSYPELDEAMILMRAGGGGGGAVSDVQIDGTSILSSGVANIPIASNSDLGVVTIASDGANGLNVNQSTGALSISQATSAKIKTGSNIYNPVVPSKQHEAVFYGLAKAAGDSTQAASDNEVGTYTDNAKSAIRTMIGAGTPVDVQINGTSIVSSGVANIPMASNNALGAVIANANYGIAINSSGELYVTQAEQTTVKNGGNSYKPITSARQHLATFYGLSKVAGVDLASEEVTAGIYPATAKSAILAMLGAASDIAVVEVEGLTPTISAVDGTRYICNNELTTLDISGTTGAYSVEFYTGSTPTVLTLGNGLVCPPWFDPDDLEADSRYEINVLDGFVSVAVWNGASPA